MPNRRRLAKSSPTLCEKQNRKEWATQDSFCESMVRDLVKGLPPARSDSFGMILDVPHWIGWSAGLYFDSACINSARAVHASVRALLSA